MPVKNTFLPRISIVTPSFNQGEFLDECIDSILSQNYPNLEYIIMDGGSNDSSVDIIKKYEKYLTYWQSKPDGGQYNAINEGFKRTSGEIMSWLNSDDKYHYHAFYKVAHVFDKYHDVEWVTGRHTHWGKNGDVTNIVTEYLPAHSREKFLQKKYDDPWIQQESTFWRRSLWDKAGKKLRTDLQYAGDLELWTRFFRFAQLYTVDTLLGGYRMHGNQKAVLFMDKYRAEAEQILDEEINHFEENANKELLAAPDPITVSYEELKKFLNAAHILSQHDSCIGANDPDLVIKYLLRRLTESEAVSQSLQASLEAIKSSCSWKMTKPIRYILKFIDNAVRR